MSDDADAGDGKLPDRTHRRSRCVLMCTPSARAESVAPGDVDGAGDQKSWSGSESCRLLLRRYKKMKEGRRRRRKTAVRVRQRRRTVRTVRCPGGSQYTDLSLGCLYSLTLSISLSRCLLRRPAKHTQTHSLSTRQPTQHITYSGTAAASSSHRTSRTRCRKSSSSHEKYTLS